MLDCLTTFSRKLSQCRQSVIAETGLIPFEAQISFTDYTKLEETFGPDLHIYEIANMVIVPNSHIPQGELALLLPDRSIFQYTGLSL